MPTLDNGIVIDEATTARNFTPAASVPAVFKMPRTITGVTVHHWGSDGQSFDGVKNYLASKNDRNNSAHFVLQEDRVACIVSPADAAWHSGNATGNARTIGIECRPEMTAGDLATLASLIRWLEGVYGELLVYRHQDWQNTACPGRYAGQIDNLVAAINNVSAAPPAPAPAPAAPVHDCCCHD